MHEGIRKALDAGNSLELMGWADGLEEEGKEDLASIVRWMSIWGRRPRREIKGRSRPKATIQYYWMTKPMPAGDQDDWFWAIGGPSEHSLPRVGISTIVRYSTASDAYLWAMAYLSNGGFAEVLKRNP